jgi:hypothetical protein
MIPSSASPPAPVGGASAAYAGRQLRVCFAGQPPALHAFQGNVRSLRIAVAELDAVGIAEVELVQIAVQVSFGNMLVHVIDAALEDREIAFHGVGADRGRAVAADVFSLAVDDGALVGEVLT